MELREFKKMQYKDIACAMGKDVTFDIVVGDEPVTSLPVEISKAYAYNHQY